MRFVIALASAAALIFQASAAAQEPSRSDRELAARVDATVRDTAQWLTSYQSIIFDLILGPLDTTETVTLIDQYLLGEMTDGQARASFENLSAEHWQQLSELRSRFDAIERPVTLETPQIIEVGESLSAAVEELFVHAEVLLRLEQDTFNNLSDKADDLTDFFVADIQTRRMMITALIGYNEAIRLNTNAGHPHEFLLSAMNAAAEGMIAALMIEEVAMTTLSFDEIDLQLGEIERHARRMQTYAGAGRNAIEPTRTRMTEAGQDLSASETFQAMPQIFETYTTSFDQVDRLADIMLTLVDSLEAADIDDAFWDAIDQYYLDYTSIEEELFAAQQVRTRLLTGQ